MNKTVKTTFEKFLEFLTAGNIYQASLKSKNKSGAEAKTKLSYAIEKVIKMNKSAIDYYNEALEDVRIDNAAVDEKGVLLTDEKGSYRFTKDGIKKFNADIKALKAKEYEFHAHIISELPADLDESLIKALAGFVIEGDINN